MIWFKSSHNVPRVEVKRLVGSHLDKISRTDWRHENAAWVLSTVQNGGNDVRSLGFFGDEFHKENLLKLRWVAKLSARFLLELTKNIRLLEWPSQFKNSIPLFCGTMAAELKNAWCIYFVTTSHGHVAQCLLRALTAQLMFSFDSTKQNRRREDYWQQNANLTSDERKKQHSTTERLKNGK